MSKRKTKFELEYVSGGSIRVASGLSIEIVGQMPQSKPYVVIELGHGARYFIQDKDLKLFATNILKSLEYNK